MSSIAHLFHIPVLGIGFSIDTPLKVARFGISSVISIMDDELLEKMRAHHSKESGETFTPILKKEEDHRARRITAYLDLVNRIVDKQILALQTQSFTPGNEIVSYFEMLPDRSSLKKRYSEMTGLDDGPAKEAIQEELRTMIKAGAIDVNIMAKVDNINFNEKGDQLPAEYSDALSSLRGFAKSELNSSVVFSAGYNPKLYNYIETFSDFLPDTNGLLKKKIILKVSDYRSALIQGKIMAKKGLWVSEFRIESGLNCGGHAFATDGLLLGPILEEFKNNRNALVSEMFSLCTVAHLNKNIPTFLQQPEVKITVQGGIGTSNENNFLLEHYEMDGTGWGSPFLLVPEATNVDDYTLKQLSIAKKEDYYLSDASPLGVPFNNFRKSSGEEQRKRRVDKERPGSPCYKKFLASNTEFTETPICTASRQYQNFKIKQLKEGNLPAELYEAALNNITEKDCLCEGLGAPVLLKDNLELSHKLSAVTICPGPNLAYFSGIFSLVQMVGHIYGQVNILNSLNRPNMFINELQLYIDYLKRELKKIEVNPKQIKYFETFKFNLLEGIEYYKQLLPSMKRETDEYISKMKTDLKAAIEALTGLHLPSLLK